MTRTNRQTRPTRTDSTTDRTPTTMREVSHTNPHGDPSVTNRPFQRGPVVAADGGRRGARDEEPDAEESRAEETHEDEESDDADATPMRDVDHTPPYGDGEEVDRVFERGGSEEPVESEE